MSKIYFDHKSTYSASPSDRCPLCNNNGQVPFYIVPRVGFAQKKRTQCWLRNTGTTTYQPRYFCCQICDTGSTLPIDIECDPDVY